MKKYYLRNNNNLKKWAVRLGAGRYLPPQTSLNQAEFEQDIFPFHPVIMDDVKKSPVERSNHCVYCFRRCAKQKVLVDPATRTEAIAFYG